MGFHHRLAVAATPAASSPDLPAHLRWRRVNRQFGHESAVGRLTGRGVPLVEGDQSDDSSRSSQVATDLASERAPSATGSSAVKSTATSVAETGRFPAAGYTARHEPELFAQMLIWTAS